MVFSGDSVGDKKKPPHKNHEGTSPQRRGSRRAHTMAGIVTHHKCNEAHKPDNSQRPSEMNLYSQMADLFYRTPMKDPVLVLP